MGQKNCFLIAVVAVISMSTSCHGDEGPDIGKEGAPKSVTITIDNVVGAPAAGTRATQGEFTGEGVPVAYVTDLSVFFADASGIVVETRSLYSGYYADLPENEYIFHGVSAAARQLAVSNIAGDVGQSLFDIEALAGGLALADYQVQTGIPVWGESAMFSPSNNDHGHGDGAIYVVHDAGHVTVSPLLARIEIGNIECIDLNSAVSVNDFLPRFGALDLARIGIHNTPLTTIAGPAVTYTGDAEGEAAWIAAATGLEGAWNIDPVGAGVSLNARPDAPGDAIVKYQDEVFAYNVVPGAVPGIILELSGAQKNSNVVGAVAMNFPYYVKTKALMNGDTPVQGLNAGTVYKVDFKFNCGNVKPWDELPEYICVDVTVEIPKWVVYGTVLTPSFEDPAT